MFTWGLTVLLFSVLSVLSYIDFKMYRLPDTLTLPLIFVGFLQSWLIQGTWLSSICGGAMGYILFVAVETTFKRMTGRDGLGRGDAKLMAAAGAWLGFAAVPQIALIASVSAIMGIVIFYVLYKKKLEKIPFGPFISLAFMAVWLWHVTTVNSCIDYNLY